MKVKRIFSIIGGIKEIKTITRIYQEHDKIFRKILDDKKEAIKFITKALKVKFTIQEEEIEKYNSRYVTNMLKNTEPDVIYKIKDKNIYIEIEHQTKIDYTMPVRIMEYKYAIIKSAIEKEKLKEEGYEIPKVIPIVLYTGKSKWNATGVYKTKTKKEIENITKELQDKYIIVDVNKYSKEQLLKEDI